MPPARRRPGAAGGVEIRPESQGGQRRGGGVLGRSLCFLLQLHKTPLSIAPIFNGQREGVPRSWIFTSATLAVKNDFSHFSEQMGLGNEPSMSWPSPFNYEEQGILYVPTGLPDRIPSATPMPCWTWRCR
jgi:Rad3-related DNA helicase